MAAKQDYITVAPVTPKGKWSICVRRVGTQDRFAPVAEARTQTAADSIVDALNLMQGEVKRIEVPAQRLLEGVRRDLQVAQQKIIEVTTEKNNINTKLRETERTLDRAQQDRNVAQAKLQTAEQERDRLRAEFANYRDANPEPKLVQSA